MSIKAIIFDLDGMVVNCENFSYQFAKKYGFVESYEKVILPFFKGPMQKCILGKADLKKELIPFLEKWNWQASGDDFLKYWFESENYSDSELTNYIKFLKEKRLKVYLATNQEKYRKQFILKKMGMGEIFDEVFFSCDLGYKKPEKGFFEKIMEKTGLRKEEFWYWDDEEKNVKAVSNFGFKSEIYQDFQSFKNKIEEFFKF